VGGGGRVDHVDTGAGIPRGLFTRWRWSGETRRRRWLNVALPEGVPPAKAEHVGDLVHKGDGWPLGVGGWPRIEAEADCTRLRDRPLSAPVFTAIPGVAHLVVQGFRCENPPSSGPA